MLSVTGKRWAISVATGVCLKIDVPRFPLSAWVTVSYTHLTLPTICSV